MALILQRFGILSTPIFPIDRKNFHANIHHVVGEICLVIRSPTYENTPYEEEAVGATEVE